MERFKRRFLQINLQPLFVLAFVQADTETYPTKMILETERPRCGTPRHLKDDPADPVGALPKSNVWIQHRDNGK
jgi:hypothetical protein